jgi:hypothetical protein
MNATALRQRVEIEVEVQNGSVFGRVADDGAGFEVAADVPAGHMGLSTAHERIDLASGVLAVESRLGGGTDVSFRIPILAERAPISLAVRGAANQDFRSYSRVGRLGITETGTTRETERAKWITRFRHLRQRFRRLPERRWSSSLRGSEFAESSGNSPRTDRSSQCAARCLSATAHGAAGASTRSRLDPIGLPRRTTIHGSRRTEGISPRTTSGWRIGSATYATTGGA